MLLLNRLFFSSTKSLFKNTSLQALPPASIAAAQANPSKPYPKLKDILALDVTKVLSHNITLDEIPASLASEHSRNVIARILSNEVANKKQILKTHQRNCIEAFSQSINDTGSPEVQCALWTCRIHFLQDHINLNKKDHNAKRRLVALVHRRLRMLIYLRKQSLSRYHVLLDVLGLPHFYIESFENKYMFKYRKVTRKFVPKAPCARQDMRRPQINPKKDTVVV